MIAKGVLQTEATLERAMRAANAGVTAQITSTEDRARYDYMMAKIYARLGNTEECLRCLKKANYRE